MDQECLFEELERLHHQSYAWALRCCYENKETAAEVLQNTYLKILEGKAVYRDKAVFRTWLFSIIRYTAIDYQQAEKKRSRRKVPANDLIEKLSEPISFEIDKGADSKKKIFLKALGHLSPYQNQVLHLVFYQNCTIREAAEILDLKLGTARTHYKRGKQQLKNRLVEEGYLKDLV